MIWVENPFNKDDVYQSIAQDSKLILKIRKLVEKIMSKDPRLENENNLEI